MELLTKSQVAATLQVSVRTVERLSSGVRPPLRWVQLDRGGRRYPRKFVEAYVAGLMADQVAEALRRAAA